MFSGLKKLVRDTVNVVRDVATGTRSPAVRIIPGAGGVTSPAPFDPYTPAPGAAAVPPGTPAWVLPAALLLVVVVIVFATRK